MSDKGTEFHKSFRFLDAFLHTTFRLITFVCFASATLWFGFMLWSAFGWLIMTPETMGRPNDFGDAAFGGAVVGSVNWVIAFWLGRQAAKCSRFFGPLKPRD